jgi:hypothetical protein
MPLTTDRNTSRIEGTLFSFEAGAPVYAGSMACLNAEGKLVPASITVGLTSVVGVVQRQARVGERVEVRRGVFNYTGKSGDTPELPQVGSICYVADDAVVQKTAAENAPVAGTVMDVNDMGVWVRI